MQTILSSPNPIQTPLRDTLKSKICNNHTAGKLRGSPKQQRRQNTALQEGIPALNLNLSFLNLR